MTATGGRRVTVRQITIRQLRQLHTDLAEIRGAITTIAEAIETLLASEHDKTLLIRAVADLAKSQDLEPCLRLIDGGQDDAPPLG